MGANFEASLALARGSTIFVEAANPAAAAVPLLRKSRRRMDYLLVREDSPLSEFPYPVKIASLARISCNTAMLQGQT
jgi:hypothetical protein